jgi:thioredoxin-dependent peroxiredoxin
MEQHHGAETVAYLEARESHVAGLGVTGQPSAVLQVGDKAPDFTAVDCLKRTITLSAIPGRKVVFFFPKAFSSGCTEEVQHFRDSYGKIRELGAELIGISVDKVERQCEFSRQHNLNFSLIGDESKEISRGFGVLWPIIRVDRRATFILGKDNTVEAVIHHERRVDRHLDDVLAYLTGEAGAPKA